MDKQWCMQSRPQLGEYENWLGITTNVHSLSFAVCDCYCRVNFTGYVLEPSPCGGKDCVQTWSDFNPATRYVASVKARMKDRP